MAVNLVNLESVEKVYGTRALLDGVSLGVNERDRIGVVGRNGDGKTTLVRILSKLEPADAGRVTHTGGLRLGVLTQHDSLDPSATVRQEVVGDLADHEWAGDARIRDVLTGLFGGLDLPGFPSGLDTVVGPLSGGERRRIALAKLLVAEQDLVVLDEPTNHLDVEGIAWLAGHLRSRRSALVCVTHDRWFLDQVCTRMWDVQRGTVHEYEGGYSDYVFARAERERIAAQEESRRQNLVRKELAWLRRGAPARTSKPRFRIEAANALIEDVPPPRDSAALMRFASTRLGKTVFDLEDVTVRAGDPDDGTGRVLLEHLTWQLGPGDRVSLLGVNGAGKTTLLRTLLAAARSEGTRQPSGGRIAVGRTVRLAYLSQEVDELGAGEDRAEGVGTRVLEAVEQVRSRVDLGKGREMTASQLCEHFGFGKERQWTPVADLSGGERRRLQILRLLMDEPNVLFLDEPTNDLDIETLTQLEDLLDGWPGSLVVISHDRYFVERTTDRVLALLGDRRMRMLPRGVEEYLERRERARTTGTAAPASTGKASAAPTTAAATPSAPAKPAALSRATQKELQRIERQLERIGERESGLHAEIAEHATDFQRVADLDARLRELSDERDTLETRWLELAEGE